MSGNGHHKFAPGIELPPPKRIVSLVPSMTESLFDLDLGDRLVGATDYCIYPAEKLTGIPRVGGPKNPRIDEILALSPDLVLANQEENTRQSVDAMRSAGLKVWLSFPRSVAESMDVLWALAKMVVHDEAIVRLRVLELTLSWAEEASGSQPYLRYFCPIWNEEPAGTPAWWMTFNKQTYASDVLTLIGGENVFADRMRKYPLGADLGLAQPEESGERDTRYPRVTLDEIRQADPQVILLPSEPFAFDEKHLQVIIEQLEVTQAVQHERVHLVDGSLITWHGTRLAQALRVLPQYFQQT